MKFLEQRWSRWSAWLGTLSLGRTDLWLAVAVTFLGLMLFGFAGIGGNSHAGFVFLQNIEQRSLDLRFWMRGQRAPDDRVVIVDIDEKTLQNIGSFPFPRKSYAQLIDRLSAAGASVIALDATFPTPETDSAQQALQRLQPDAGSSDCHALLEKIKDLESASDQDAEFARALKSSGNVVLGHIFLGSESDAPVESPLAREYFNIVWAKAFPQVLKVKAKDGRDFDMGQAWMHNGGKVY